MTSKTFLLVVRKLGNSEGGGVAIRLIILYILTKELMVILLAGVLFCMQQTKEIDL